MRVKNQKLEQQIAVFGEAGSGKTVLISSFYGATQEPTYLKKNMFYIVADNPGQGSRLHQNYLGMRNSGKAPLPTRFTATPYSFSVKFPHSAGKAKATKAQQFDELRLIWHDYPGEWFEEDVTGQEAERRVATFRSLLGSDVAFLLVDGQKLLDHPGEEERYLKSLLGNFRNGLLLLRKDLLPDDKPLIVFPRIWLMALSKSDLLPNLNVYQFRDLLIEKAAEEIEELRKVIAGLVEGSEALSVGEDFMLLSSAKFDPGEIDVTKRVGLELILPLAAILPFERYVQWARSKLLPGKLGETLMTNAGALAEALVGRRNKVPGKLGAMLKYVDPEMVEEAVRLAGQKLQDLNDAARHQHNNLSATLTRFKIDLDSGEEEQILLRSKK